ncbi:hypothetical protein KIN20_036814 [Parelaphostrongylus tenuis]|uniref:Uncharacterized protein n=1 Tax=Parelaphostrongylus tenuis TaxID=148309 RepID=A0AAD5RD36_PARTN|nr:hypothetical protein KIN20_036814 [Parelaphostrongylus tenuis]
MKRACIIVGNTVTAICTSEQPEKLCVPPDRKMAVLRFARQRVLNQRIRSRWTIRKLDAAVQEKRSILLNVTLPQDNTRSHNAKSVSQILKKMLNHRTISAV